MQARNQEIFEAGKVSWNGATSINVSCATNNRKPPQGNILVFFSPRCSYQCILNENLAHNCSQTGHIFPKLEHFFYKIRALFFYFQKRAGEKSPPSPPLVAHLRCSTLCELTCLVLCGLR